MNRYKILLLSLLGVSVLKAQDTTYLVESWKGFNTKAFNYAYGYSFADDLTKNTPFLQTEIIEKEILKGMNAALKIDSLQLSETNDYLRLRLNMDSMQIANSDRKSTAFHLGYSALGNVIYNMRLNASDFNIKFIKRGFQDCIRAKKSINSEAYMQWQLDIYFENKKDSIQQIRQLEIELMNNRIKKLNEEFLLENVKRDSIVQTESGLQYQILKQGSGEAPSLDNIVVAHYIGRLINGDEFDNSYKEEQPVSFLLNNVILGWQEGLQLMNTGSKFRFFIPPSLAYGSKGPASLPPFSVLIFDIELLEIKAGRKVDTLMSRTSYAYGYAIGQSLMSINLSEAEMDPGAFIQGFSKGFEINEENLAIVEKMLKTRMDANKQTEGETAQRIAFSIGIVAAASILKDLKLNTDDFDYNALGHGFQTAAKSERPLIPSEEMSKLMELFMQRKQVTDPNRFETDRIALLDQIKIGKNFIDSISTLEDVELIEAGLCIQLLKKGTGKRPAIDDYIEMHYTGRLVDGTIFDQSDTLQRPPKMQLSSLMSGFRKVLPKIPAGSQLRMYIAPEHAYQNQRVGRIPPGATLIFDLDLISVLKGDK